MKYRLTINFVVSSPIVKEDLNWIAITDYLKWLKTNTNWVGDITSVEIIPIKE